MLTTLSILHGWRPRTSLLLLVGLTACVTPAPDTPSEQPMVSIEAVTSDADPAPLPSPDWQPFRQGDMEIWLPDSFESVDPAADLPVIIDQMKQVGPEFEQIAQGLEQRIAASVLFAFDSEIGSSGFLTNVNIAAEERWPSEALPDSGSDVPAADASAQSNPASEDARPADSPTADSQYDLQTYLELVVSQLPPQIQVVEQEIVSMSGQEAGRLVSELEALGAKQLAYVIETDRTLWTITFSTGISEFDDRVETFEASMQTFKPEGEDSAD